METELQKLISIVVPVYNEGTHIWESMAYVGKLCEKASIPYELVLVDDGSTDDSWQVICAMAKEDARITAVRLSRNFGKEPALCAGLDIASGDAVIVMDADLQHPPEKIPEMVRLWQEGAEVVEGVKSSRGKESVPIVFVRSCFTA